MNPTTPEPTGIPAEITLSKEGAERLAAAPPLDVEALRKRVEARQATPEPTEASSEPWPEFNKWWDQRTSPWTQSARTAPPGRLAWCFALEVWIHQQESITRLEEEREELLAGRRLMAQRIVALESEVRNAAPVIAAVEVLSEAEGAEALLSATLNLRAALAVWRDAETALEEGK